MWNSVCVCIIIYSLARAQALICTCSSLILTSPSYLQITKVLVDQREQFFFSLLLLLVLYHLFMRCCCLSKNQIFAAAVCPLECPVIAGFTFFLFCCVCFLGLDSETFHLRFTVAWWSFLHRVCPGPRSLPRANFFCTLAGERRMQTFCQEAQEANHTDCLFWIWIVTNSRGSSSKFCHGFFNFFLPFCACLSPPRTAPEYSVQLWIELSIVTFSLSPFFLIDCCHFLRESFNTAASTHISIFIDFPSVYVVLLSSPSWLLSVPRVLPLYSLVVRHCTAAAAAALSYTVGLIAQARTCLPACWAAWPRFYIVFSLYSCYIIFQLNRLIPANVLLLLLL